MGISHGILAIAPKMRLEILWKEIRFTGVHMNNTKQIFNTICLEFYFSVNIYYLVSHALAMTDKKFISNS